ncbi:MAG: pyridoxal 5'-phosphate synthase glutaminase subunit PdxT [Armatimonadota bacterium]
MRIGVLALQGAISEHINLLKKCGVEPVEVKYPDQLDSISGLILPGGESTAIGRLLERYSFIEKIKDLAKKGRIALYGTCAGMVLLSTDTGCGEVSPYTLGLMDIRVKRNAFGRQRESFEAGLKVSGLGEKDFPAVFIRAPVVSEAGKDVEILSKYENRIVAVRQGNILAASFHPELTGDKRFHEYFIKTVVGADKSAPV